MKQAIRFVYLFINLIFLIYLFWPFSPSNIESFSDLPNSLRSTLSGDTWQVPNLKAYYSDNYRNLVVDYYSKQYQHITKFPFPPVRFNYPPEEAFKLIKDQTQSTYLEEYTYPFRESLYINGLEPLDEKTKQPRFAGADKFFQNDRFLETKVIIRYRKYPYLFRLIVLLLINLCLYYALRVLKVVKKFAYEK